MIDRLQLVMSRRRLPTFYLQIAGGGVATLLAVGAAALSDEIDPSLAVTANIIMLLSGIGFMGALQDALSGFYLTASARIIEALLATAGLIAGVSGGLTVAEIAGVEIGHVVPGRVVALDTLTVAGGRRRHRGGGVRGGVVLTLAGGGADRARGRGRDADLGGSATTPASTAPGPPVSPRSLVGLVAYGVAGWARVPPLVVVVSAIVPLLPGLSIFRGLSLLTAGDAAASSRGVLAMVTAASVALALAAGVILGEYLAQPIKREARRLESRLAGPRLVGPFRARTDGRRRSG